MSIVALVISITLYAQNSYLTSIFEGPQYKPPQRYQ